MGVSPMRVAHESMGETPMPLSMSGRPIKVLLVEDNPGDALLLRETLADTAAVIEWAQATTLGQALEQLDGSRAFDVILLDLSLPDSQGLQTFRRLHEHAPDAPVVMLTGMADENLAIEAMHEGAQDYLVKGSADGTALLRSMRYAIERTRRRRAERELQLAQAEMMAARTIQQRLFPQSAPQVHGFDIAGASSPAVATGGDYFDFFFLSDDRLALVIADVSGHGVGPALLMAETRAYLRAFATSCPHLPTALAQVNRAVARDTQSALFVTLLAVCLHPANGSLIYASAGHPSGYIVAEDGSIKGELKSTGMPLGVDHDAAFEAVEAGALTPGDTVLLLTDGIVEALAPPSDARAESRKVDAREPFGTDRAIEIVRSNRHKPAREIVDALHEAVNTFTGSEPQVDDVTAVILKAL